MAAPSRGEPDGLGARLGRLCMLRMLRLKGSGPRVAGVEGEAVRPGREAKDASCLGTRELKRELAWSRRCSRQRESLDKRRRQG